MSENIKKKMPDDGVRYLAFKKEMTEQEYLRNTLVDFAADRGLPDDIFESEFSAPICDTVQAIALQAKVSIDYTCSIGYRRHEEYQEYNRHTGKYEKKTKTITDWHPHNGAYTYDGTGFSENTDTPRPEIGEFISTLYKTTKEENKQLYNTAPYEAEAPLTPNLAAVEEAGVDLKRSAVSACKKSLPGDELSDFSYRATLDLNSLTSFSAPAYHIDYKYKGTNYRSSSFAAGKFKRWGAEPDVSAEIENELLKTTNPLFIASVVTSILTLFFSVMDLVVLTVICFLLASAAFAMNNIVTPQVMNTRYDRALKQKQQDLQKLLTKYGLAPATPEELSKMEEKKPKSSSKMTFKVTFAIGLYAISALFACMKVGFLFVIALGLGITVGYMYFTKYKKNQK